MPSRFDKEKARKNMAAVLDKMHGETDLALLNEYRRLFGKEISLFRRSWAAAWLFMYYDRNETPQLRIVEKQKGRGKSAAAAAGETPALPEEESKRLFISVGKNRRLYPREIISLIISKAPVSREDIGVIRILDNYSFVQVRDAKADEIIEALNGIRFRGRTLTVNYAKPKSSEPQAESE